MKNSIKKICALLIVISLILSTVITILADESADDLENFFDSLIKTDVTEEENEPKTFKSSNDALDDAIRNGKIVTLENKAVSLQLDKRNGNIYVTDKVSGKLWISNPYDANSDKIASGIMRTNLLSQMVVTYIKDKNLTSVNNYVASTNKNGAKYSVSKDSIRIDYSFVNEGFIIPLVYQLTESGFTAKVLFNDIVDTKDIRVHKIAVLPYFGAAGSTEEGYMLIPDGSGALIDFNNPYLDNFPYKKAFYGGDKSITPNVSTAFDRNLMLPVYGMKNGDNAFIATITSGAEAASLYACVSRIQCNYNRIYTEAVFRTYDTVNLKDSIGKPVYAKYSALDSVKLSEYAVSYSLLSGKKANYVGMADVVRDHLIDSGLKKNDNGNAELFVDFYGATLKEKAFLGIRYTGVEKLTTFSQAKTIMKFLKKAGVNDLSVGYRKFSDSELKNKISSKVLPHCKLGGKKAYNDLISYAANNNIKVYPYADFITFQKNGNGYSSFSDVILGLELSMIKRYPYKINDGHPDNTKAPNYLVSADRYPKAQKQILNTLKKYNSAGVLFDESVNFLYNDFASKGYQCDRTVTAMQKVYESIAKQGQKMLMSSPNAYALKFADSLTDIPMTSSQYTFFECDVPFLQIVLKGQVKYSSEALNIEGLSDSTLLQLIETGSQPKFSMIYVEGKYLLGTDLTNLYGATYKACLSAAITYYKEIETLCKKTGDSKIIDHTRLNDVVTVTYENGVKVFINYNKTDQNAADGKIVPGLGYRIEG